MPNFLTTLDVMNISDLFRPFVLLLYHTQEKLYLKCSKYEKIAAKSNFTSSHYRKQYFNGTGGKIRTKQLSFIEHLSVNLPPKNLSFSYIMNCS